MKTPTIYFVSCLLALALSIGIGQTVIFEYVYQAADSELAEQVQLKPGMSSAEIEQRYRSATETALTFTIIVAVLTGFALGIAAEKLARRIAIQNSDRGGATSGV